MKKYLLAATLVCAFAVPVLANAGPFYVLNVADSTDRHREVQHDGPVQFRGRRHHGDVRHDEVQQEEVAAKPAQPNTPFNDPRSPASSLGSFCFGPWLILFLVRRFEQRQQALEQVGGRGRAAFDVQIDGDDLVDAAGHRIAAGENAAIGGAIADRHHPFRVRRRSIGALKRLAHVLGDGARH